MPLLSSVLRTAVLLVMCSLEMADSVPMRCCRALKMVISVAKSLAFKMIVGAKSASGRVSGVGHLPLRFHGLGAFAKQGLVALAADECKVLIVASLLENNFRQLFFSC